MTTEPNNDEPTTDKNILRRRADEALRMHMLAQADTLSSLRKELMAFRSEYAQEIHVMKREFELHQELSEPILAWVNSRMERQKKIERAAEKGVLAAIGVFAAGIAAFILDVIRRKFS